MHSSNAAESYEAETSQNGKNFRENSVTTIISLLRNLTNTGSSIQEVPLLPFKCSSYHFNNPLLACYLIFTFKRNVIGPSFFFTSRHNSHSIRKEYNNYIQLNPLFSHANSIAVGANLRVSPINRIKEK